MATQSRDTIPEESIRIHKVLDPPVTLGHECERMFDRRLTLLGQVPMAIATCDDWSTMFMLPKTTQSHGSIASSQVHPLSMLEIEKTVYMYNKDTSTFGNAGPRANPDHAARPSLPPLFTLTDTRRQLSHVQSRPRRYIDTGALYQFAHSTKHVRERRTDGQHRARRDTVFLPSLLDASFMSKICKSGVVIIRGTTKIMLSISGLIGVYKR
ncbi:hypothetical protein FPV67DRAFT_1681316 [Lyophyllum atratum]|nr:hypothetical protein FPV67DRAFT_1681316 [Lyophyllum atratum]